MGLTDWLRPPRHLLALFAVVTIVPAGLLCWLGWKVLQQDQDLDGPRAQQRLQQASARIVDGLRRDLRDTLDQLPAWISDPPASLTSGAVLVRLDSRGVESHAGAPLVFTPVLPAWAEPPASTWDAGEQLEHREHDLAGATKIFQELARSTEPAIRAGALVRLAGTLVKLGLTDEALDAYRALETVDARIMDGPAALVARATECELLATLRRRDVLTTKANALRDDLARGKWAIDRGTYEFRSAQLSDWIGPAQLDDDAVALAAAIEEAWTDRVNSSGSSATRGFRAIKQGRRPVLLVWRGDSSGTIALAATPEFISREWSHTWSSEPVNLALTDLDGGPVVGSPAGADVDAVISRPDESGLPWTLRVSAAGSIAEVAAANGRRWLIGIGLAVLIFLIPTGGYVVARALQKELAVARLQADFVSAVSHEFRTPLTAIAHLTDRLQRDEGLSPERRRQYYDALARDTHRLGRFVETLLDFGRMEAGTASVRLQPDNLESVVTSVVNEFRGDAASAGHQVNLNTAGPPPAVLIDRDSFGRAMWNLLDNAAKYSPADAPIDVDLEKRDGRAVVSVRDRGLGVPIEERRQIFKKFVRGAEHVASGVRGTGVGLAMVDQIVRGHGGEVRLESEVGVGSVFSIVLPCHES